MNSVNTAGHTKKVTTNAIVCMAYCISNIIGPQFFKAAQAPLYPPGMGAMLVSYALSIFTMGPYMLYCWSENRRRDRLDDTRGGDRTHLDSDFRDLTDRENVHFCTDLISTKLVRAMAQSTDFLDRAQLKYMITNFLIDTNNRDDVENWEDVQRATIEAMGDIVVQIARAQGKAQVEGDSPEPMDLDDGEDVKQEGPDSDGTSDPDDFVRDDIPPQALQQPKNTPSSSQQPYSSSGFEEPAPKNPRGGKGATKTNKAPRKNDKVPTDRVLSLEERKTNRCVLGCGVGYTTTDRLKRHYKDNHAGWEEAVVAAGQTVFQNERKYTKRDT
ncbi:allantoin permease [Colletotrichum salicis]|uniref:Allantoin permease n=1 Tax=Colletotrichum salicis TaxID=1209931 RepID=A0A135V6L9_9PEZI|nr:allantoin permease [Colletotrichum salicis]